VQLKLAILTVLAARPNGRATLAGMRYEVEALTADADQRADISSPLDDIDIFQSGLVITQGDWLLITEAGRAALEAIEGPSEASRNPPPPSSPHSMRMIDDLIGTEERQKIFDLELRGDQVDPDPEGVEAESVPPMPALPTAPQDTDPDLLPDNIARPVPYGTGEAYRQRGEPIAVVAAGGVPTHAPNFLVRDGHGSPVYASGRGVPRWSRLSRLLSVRLQQAFAIWRRHLERGSPSIKAGPRRSGNVSGAAIALLSLLVLVICAGAVFALVQIRSLKSEIATLQRELSPLRERAARTDLLEKAKQNADQQRESQFKSGAENNRVGAAPRTDQTALNLTFEEVRIIRDFIKPAPGAGTPAPAINVGDTVNVATIPLPSPLTEKIPKLLGARFTTRNGSIIILRRDSRQADAVLPPS
jgi:hypothetical protein